MGYYKKHITQSKEIGDAWAINLYNKQNKIQQIIKGVIQRISCIGKNNLGLTCKNVINCAQPPVRIHLGFAKCFITGVNCDKCVDISKNGRKNKEIYVHCKFAYFFLFLWYICKLEYVIKACCKQWYDHYLKINHKGIKRKDVTCIHNGVNAELLEHFFSENQQICNDLYLVFDKALQYVNKTLDVYNEEFSNIPMIDPPSSYFENNT
jgi:hypothetical protein